MTTDCADRLCDGCGTFWPLSEGAHVTWEGQRVWFCMVCCDTTGGIG